MTRLRWLLAGALAIGAAACAGAPQDGAAGTLEQSIVEGEPSGPSEDGVVLLRGVDADEREVVCTATLVAPNLVLTARHCVSYFVDGLFTCTPRGELVESGDGAGRLGLHLQAEKLEIYGRELPRSEPLAHGQQVISTLSETICVNDIAFVVLDTALDLPVVPMRLGRPALVGELSVVVGYGLDGDQTVLDFESQPRKRRGDLAILAVGPDSVEEGVKMAPPRALLLEGPSGCLGDSGGPLLAQATGAVLGVYSLQQGESCKNPNVRHQLVHVPPFELLIQQAFAAAGAEPLPEPEAAPSGAGAGAGGEAGARVEPSEGGTATTGGEAAVAGDDAPDAGGTGCDCAVAPADEPSEPLAALLLFGLMRRRGRRSTSDDRRADPQPISVS